MKRILLSALLGLLVAGAALAQTAGTNTVLRNGYYFNATTGQKTNADGDAKVEEADKDRDYSFSHTLFNADTLSIGAVQDSSAWYATGTAKQLYLRIQVHGKQDFARLAIQVRCAYENPASNDTTLIALWMPSVTMGATAPATDSLAYSQAGRAPTMFAGGASASSEFVVTTARHMSNAAGTLFSAVWIPLADTRGVFLWSPYISVRIRVLGATVTPVKLSAQLVGRP